MALCMQEDLRPRLPPCLGNGRLEQHAANALAALLALNCHTSYLSRCHQASAPEELFCFRACQKMRAFGIESIHLLGFRHTLLAHEYLCANRF